MSAKQQHNNILLAILGFLAVVVIVALIGFFTIDQKPDEIQGEVEVSEYRVSSKVPGRILEIRVKEGDFVRVGDTLAILDAPEVRAKKTQAQSAEDAAAAMSQMAQRGARKQQVQAAYQLWQQAKAAAEVTKKSYDRVQRLFNEGVVTAQKRDEVFAQYKASEAQEKAAKSQYDMAVEGARAEAHPDIDGHIAYDQGFLGPEASLAEGVEDRVGVGFGAGDVVGPEDEAEPLGKAHFLKESVEG